MHRNAASMCSDTAFRLRITCRVHTVASVDSTTSKKPKKLMNPDGKTVYVKDGSNKTKSGRFKRECRHRLPTTHEHLVNVGLRLFLYRL